MPEEPRAERSSGLPEGLRAAIERTLAATTGSASGTRRRAQELLDDVARRGEEAREGIARRGQDAREDAGAVAGRVVEAIRDLGLARGEDLRALEERIEALERRLERFEQKQSDPKAEG